MIDQPDPFTLALNALLRPSRYTAYLAGGRSNVWRAIAAAGLWVCVALVFIALVIGQLVPVGLPGYIGALVYGPALALMIAGLLTIITGAVLPPRVAAPFWITRCLLAVTPTCSLLLGLGMSIAFGRQLDSWAALLLLIGLGAWLGGGLDVLLVLRKLRHEAAPVRAVLGGGLLVIAIISWLSPALRAGPALLLAPFCVGFAIGVLRPLSWLWQAPLSLCLSLLAALGAPPVKLLSWHPVRYDELSLLPLPGLARLLSKVCAADTETGSQALLDVDAHPAHRDAAARAIALVVRDQRSAHALLFRLSTEPEGAALLGAIVERSRHTSQLLAGYSGLAAVDNQSAWRAVLRHQRPHFTPYAAAPGGAAMLSLLDTGVAALGSDRYLDAVRALATVRRPSGVVADPLWRAVDTLLVWASASPDEVDQVGWSAVLVEALEEVDGWPAMLMAAVAEHLTYLERVDQLPEGV